MTRSPGSDAISKAIKKYPDASSSYIVPTRGRPENNPRDAAIREIRRREFGNLLREYRILAGLSLSQAAQLAKINSSRKLAQYETNCYPPGTVALSLADTYGIGREEMCLTVLRYSDPDMYLGLTGTDGYIPEEQEISHQIKLTAVKKDA